MPWADEAPPTPTPIGTAVGQVVRQWLVGDQQPALFDVERCGCFYCQCVPDPMALGVVEVADLRRSVGAL